MGPRNELIQLIKADQYLFNRLAQAAQHLSLEQSALDVANIIALNSNQLTQLINQLNINQIEELLIIARQIR